jgi:ABC-type sugar transport system permease subunit
VPASRAPSPSPSAAVAQPSDWATAGRRLPGLGLRPALPFILPGLILFLAFVVYPFLVTIASSFFSIRPAGADIVYTWAGSDWFQKALVTDRTFQSAMRNTISWAAWSIVIDIPLAFVLALALRQRVRGWRLLRVAWFVPLLLSPVLIGLVWRSILRFDGGLLNELLRTVGLGFLARDWLGGDTALIWLFLMTTWATVGFYMVLILAALEDFPEDLLDAARVDGASAPQLIRHVVVPLLRPVLITLVIITFVFKMRIFDLVWVTTQGGPYGSTETVITWVVKQAFYFQGAVDLGYPAAMSTIWLVVIAFGIWLIRRVLAGREIVEY